MEGEHEVRTLSAAEWEKVFRARCESKQGHFLTPEQQELVKAAWESDKKRYAALEPEVFNATVPFGSSARRR